YLSAKRYVVTSVPDAMSFTFACPGVADGTYTASATGLHLNIWAYPAVQVAGTADRPWTGAGTLISTEQYKNFAEVYLPVFTPEQPVPSAPCSLGATSTGTARVHLNWTNCSHGQVQFVVERRSNNPDDSFLPVGVVSGNTASFVDSVQQSGCYIY